MDVLPEDGFQPLGVPEGVGESETWRLFLNARERCFQSIRHHRTMGSGEGTTIHLEPADDADGQALRNSIQNYLNRYVQVLSEVMASPQPDPAQLRLLCSMDTLELAVHRAEERVRALLVLPTHPLKLGWSLGHWDFVMGVVEKLLALRPADRRHCVDEDLLARLQPHNLPAFAADQRGAVYINGGTLLFAHSVMVPPETLDPEGVVGEVAYMVGLDEDADGTTSLTAPAVADRLGLFCQLHPYLPAFRVQAVNPGRGGFLEEALRRYAQPLDDDDDVGVGREPLDLIVHGRAGPQTPAPGLDRLLRDLQQDRGDRRASHLLPSVQLARRSLGLSEVRNLPGRDVNVSVVSDVFSPRLTTVLPEDDDGLSTSGEGLLTRWLTRFSLQDSGCRWTRYVRVGDEDARADLLTRRFLTGHALHLSGIAKLLNPRAESGTLPAVTLDLGPEDKQLLDYLHDQSEWVVTVDRNMGVEFYDYPREPELFRESERYIIDHVPEFTDGLAHRLIVTTSWHGEIADILRRVLDELELTSDDASVTAVLNLLKAISGRLAMRVIGDPNHAREVVGLALVADYLRSRGELDRTILVPVDPHAHLFGARRRESQPSLRCDLLAVTLTPKTLRAAFIEVKFRTRSEDMSSDALLDRMIMQMEHTRDHFMARYGSTTPRPDHSLVRSELSSVLAYYLDRAWRHGWILCREDYDTLRSHVRRLETAYPQPTAICEGFLVIPTIPDTREIVRGDHRIRVIGRRAIDEETQFRTVHPPTVEVASAAPAEEPHTGRGDEPMLEPSTAERGRTMKGRETTSSPQVSTAERDAAPAAPDTEAPAVALGRSVLNDQQIEWTPSLQGSPHVLLVGSTGSGKSTTVRHMLKSLALRQVPFLVLDFHGDLTDSLHAGPEAISVASMDASGGLPFSPLEPVNAPGQPPNSKTMSYEVAEIIGFVCGLGEMQRDLVYRALCDCYDLSGMDEAIGYPSLARLRARLEDLEREPGAPRNVVARCRQLLDFGLFADVTDGAAFQDMLRQPTAIVLASLQIEQLQYAAVSFMLRRVYRQMFLWGEQEQARLLVVLDEAHRVAKDPTLPRLMKEGRKFGVGVIVASQEIHDFHGAVVHNAGTKILFRTNYPESKAMAKFVQSRGMREGDFARALEGLPVGRAFVQTQQMPQCIECVMHAN